MYINASDFCALILYPATLSILLITSSNFLMVSLGFSMYGILSSANSENLTCCFPIWIPFISFSSLVSIASASKTILNNSGESGHHCLFPNLTGDAFNVSPLRIMFAVSLSYMIWVYHICCEFIIYEVGSFHVNLWNFYHKWVLYIVKIFFCIYWDYHMAFMFQFVNMVYHID